MSHNMAMRVPRWTLACAALAAGIAVRAPFLFQPDGHVYTVETIHIADALASGRGFADAFGCGHGPTAHLAPGYPVLLAALKLAAGAHFRDVLMLFSIAVSVLAYALLPWLSRRLGLGSRPGWIGMIVGLLLPLVPGLEAHGQWENPLAALVLVLCLGVSFSSSAWLAGAAWGAAFLLSPALLPVMLVWIAWRGLPAWRSSLLALAVSLAVVSPWMVRNYVQFGRVFWIRDNMPLELRLAYGPGAGVQFDLANPINDLHPGRPQACRELKRSGEIAYMDRMREQAFAWILRHPASAFALTLRRAWRFWWPELGLLRGAVAFACGLLAVIGFWKRCRLLLGVLAVYPLVYYVVAASARYREPIQPIILLGAGLGILALASRARRPDTVPAPEEAFQA